MPGGVSPAPAEPSGAEPAAGRPTSAHGATSATPATAVTSAAPVPSGAPPEAAQIFDRIRADLSACYERGRAAAPAMSDGTLTLHIAVDSTGRTACVVPSHDTGLTQEVEDCMRKRVERERYESAPSFTEEIPIAVRKGTVKLGESTEDEVAIDNVETHGIPNALPVIEGLLPALDGCLDALDVSSRLRVVHVGGRVGKDGRVECALATGVSSMSLAVTECVEGVLERARFSPPKSGSGLVSIPIKVLSRRVKARGTR